MSSIAARAGARVALIERERTGGDCLWTGCVPSKSLIAAAALAHRMRHADSVGLDPVEPRVGFSRVLEHVSRAIATIAPHDSPERLRAAGVEVTRRRHAIAGGARAQIAQFDYGRSDRAITAGEAYGFAKLVADPRGRLVGATVAAPPGGEAIAELAAWVHNTRRSTMCHAPCTPTPHSPRGPRAADKHVAARYSSPWMRAVARPLLTVLRAVERRAEHAHHDQGAPWHARRAEPGVGEQVADCSTCRRRILRASADTPTDAVARVLRRGWT